MPSLTKVKMSQRLAVVVKVGAVFVGHFTLVKVPVKPPEPEFTIKINDLLEPTAGMVNVQLPVIVTVCTVPFAREIVTAVELLPMAYSVST